MDEFSLFEDNVNGGGVLAAGRHYLQEATLSPSTLFPSFSPAPTASMSPTAVAESTVPPNDGAVLRNTCIIWCSVYVVVLIVYGILKKRYPRAYNVRSWAESVKTPLADDFHGSFDWLWKLAWISDDDMRKECGMDALCFLRVFRFGFKICAVGMFNSLWLCPIYATSNVTEDTDYITDPIASISVSKVPPESRRFIATTISAYLLFGYTMYLILQEFEWFTEQRHQWLMEREPRNYGVFVRGIPSEYRTSAQLLKYFRGCFREEDVLEARVALLMANLEGKVAKREATVWKLEHAINMEDIKGKTPTVNNPLKRKEGPRNAITVYAEELTTLNDEITREKARLLTLNDPDAVNPDMEQYSYNRNKSVAEGGASVAGGSVAGGGSVTDGSYAGGSYAGGFSTVSSMTGLDTAILLSKSEDTDAAQADGDESAVDTTAGKKGKSQSKSFVPSKFTETMGKTVGAAGGLANTALNVFSNEDGKATESGFVTFASLRVRQAALQMVHHPTPFVMDAFEAPDPDDVFWPNCARTHKDLQVGKFLSVTLTILLCFFWTIPMAFIVSLTSAEAIGDKIKFIGRILERHPFIADVLTQLAPLILIAVNELLKIFLEIFSMLEGPISGAVVEASMFQKLTIFMIVQTFFVSAISGSIFAELKNIVDNPTSIVNLLATTLPGQSTYFLQILLVQTAIVTAMELLRISQIIIAIIRSFMSPKLTEKERNKPVFGFLRPLSDPREFEFADHFSNSVLYFMVLFVYSCTAPIVNWFLGGCFLALAAMYRNNFVYTYPVTDSGGRMWIIFMKTVPIAVLIGQITLLGLLGLKIAGIAVILMIPLLIITVLFMIYINQEHYTVLEYLPSREAMKKDGENSRNGRADLEFLKEAFLQPALKAENELRAENMTVAHEIRYTGARYATPPGSEADIEPETEEDIIFEDFDGSIAKD